MSKVERNKIATAIESNGFTISSLAEALQWDYHALYRIISGARKTLDVREHRALEEFLKIKINFE